MALQIYNTLSRRKEAFEPLQPGRVNMYVCGPTVYDLPHLGHAKSYVAFDVVVRYLRFLGLDVLYVQNITDVGHLADDADDGEDKIEHRARQRRVEPMALVETYTREYFSAMAALNCLPPDICPRATGHIPEMIDLIQRLIAAGHAYVSEGNVYFDVQSFASYGQLSRRKLDDQTETGRIEPGAGKRSPLDFALWKSAEGTGHLMKWTSPWGPGFPGWHVECSAMAMKYLGVTLDIHGAGMDNMFPHNEDEIAQSEAATGAPFARYWMHNGTVRVEGEKMSKSKGNFRTITEEIERWGSEALRFWAVSSHYRSAIDYTEEGLQEAAGSVKRFRIAVQNAERYLTLPATPDDPGAAALAATVERAPDRFREAMDDDFNTPVAVAELHRLATDLNFVTAVAAGQHAAAADLVRRGLELLRLEASVLGLSFDKEAGSSDNDLVEHLIGVAIEARQALRVNRQFEAADALRQRLATLGIMVEDRAGGGATWRIEEPAQRAD